MSGIEILGLAASVIQIAELGGKLSLKLFTFTRKVKDADKNIDALSRDIAVTGNVLQQLGNTLSKKNNVRICSQDAIDTARSLVIDTSEVFQKLERLVDGEDKAHTSRIRRGIGFKQRFRFVALESEIEQVQANLERLKSSLLVILNVLIFAEQLRNQEVPAILEDQRDLIKTLAAEKNENEKRYENIIKAITASQHSSSQSTTAASSVTTLNFSQAHSSTSTLVNASDADSLKDVHHTAIPSTGERLLDLPPGLKHHHQRIKDHTELVQNLLTEIASVKYKLDHGTRGRLHDGVLDIHWNEWGAQRQSHPFEHFERILAQHDMIVQYWTDRNHQLITNSLNQRQQPQASIPIQYAGVPGHLSEDGLRTGSGTGNHALQDYQMQLMLLEKQNKKRLMMARQEEELSYARGGDTPPGQSHGSPPTSPYVVDSRSSRPLPAVTPPTTHFGGDVSPPPPPLIPLPTENQALPPSQQQASQGPPTNIQTPWNDVTFNSDPNGKSFNDQFNLDFSVLENTDVLENFDFDSFLNDQKADAIFDTDAQVLYESAQGYSMSPQGSHAGNRITKSCSPPPPPQSDRPLVSATYIPSMDSFGPGVGIPPLDDVERTEYRRTAPPSTGYQELVNNIPPPPPRPDQPSTDPQDAKRSTIPIPIRNAAASALSEQHTRTDAASPIIPGLGPAPTTDDRDTVILQPIAYQPPSQLKAHVSDGENEDDGETAKYPTTTGGVFGGNSGAASGDLDIVDKLLMQFTTLGRDELMRAHGSIEGGIGGHQKVNMDRVGFGVADQERVEDVLMGEDEHAAVRLGKGDI